jgi:hypothetical protein
VATSAGIAAGAGPVLGAWNKTPPTQHDLAANGSVAETLEETGLVIHRTIELLNGERSEGGDIPADYRRGC